MWIERFFSHRSRWQGLPEELVVVLVDFLNFFLTPATHSVTDVSLEAEAKRHYGIPDAGRQFGSFGQNGQINFLSVSKKKTKVKNSPVSGEGPTKVHVKWKVSQIELSLELL